MISDNTQAKPLDKTTVSGSTKLKTYVLLVSENFPKTHSKSGELTGFPFAIEIGEKKHTIRNNYGFWKQKIDEVNKGNAILSVRKWSGKPYRSSQIIIKEFNKNSNIGIEKIEYSFLLKEGWNFCLRVDNENYKVLEIPTLANNDFLEEDDFREWFDDYDKSELAVIHFTPFRYCH